MNFIILLFILFVIYILDKNFNHGYTNNNTYSSCMTKEIMLYVRLPVFKQLSGVVKFIFIDIEIDIKYVNNLIYIHYANNNNIILPQLYCYINIFNLLINPTWNLLQFIQNNKILTE